MRLRTSPKNGFICSQCFEERSVLFSTRSLGTNPSPEESAPLQPQWHRLCPPHSCLTCITLHQWEEAVCPGQSPGHLSAAAPGACAHPVRAPLPHLRPCEGPAGAPAVDAAQTSAETHSYHPGQVDTTQKHTQIFISVRNNS